MEPGGLGPDPDSVSLLMGIQSFYRLTFQSDSTLSLADIDGGLWAIPARSVQGVRVRMVSPTTAAMADAAAESHVIPLRRPRLRGESGAEALTR